VDDGVECNHPGQRRIGRRQREQVSLLELYVGVSLPGLAQQVCREIKSAHLDTTALEKRGRVTGSASEVINSAGPDLGGEPGQ
jgi:hypothetical protein